MANVQKYQFSFHTDSDIKLCSHE